MTPQRSNIVAGPTALVDAVLANYQCGHCNSETTVALDANGTAHLLIHHDDGCPVLTGTLSAAPDIARAAQT
ncbi:hypothetical protein [Streptomyces sp. cmx-10-25]|uniref:hypothetical protein n=1 Tax=Streptomyces sp. cmx-10-25 TaxID=2790919 RepID=UPI00397F8AF2